jgi:hypothetical protein
MSALSSSLLLDGLHIMSGKQVCFQAMIFSQRFDKAQNENQFMAWLT